MHFQTSLKYNYEQIFKSFICQIQGLSEFVLRLFNFKLFRIWGKHEIQIKSYIKTFKEKNAKSSLNWYRAS